MLCDMAWTLNAAKTSLECRSEARNESLCVGVWLCINPSTAASLRMRSTSRHIVGSMALEVSKPRYMVRRYCCSTLVEKENDGAALWK